ncbi:Methionine aminopeptidase 1 [Paecilomyces lecythidis]
MALPQPCLVANCTKSGTLRCTGCDRLSAARYCSTTCQKSDWKTHKRTCAGVQKYNCFLIKTSPVSTAGPDQPLRDADYIVPFHLRDYGVWGKEMKELSTRLGWPETNDAGKFYPPEGDDWYYYAYCCQWSRSGNLPENELASRMVGRKVRGDVAIVRSGPEDSNDYPERFSRTELLKVAEFYQWAVPRDIFAERERSRMARKYGFGPKMLGIPLAFNDHDGMFTS